jgi:adenine phosphoribosyltransferase
MSVDVDRIRSLVRDVPDFPRPGVGFKDLTPLLADGAAYAEVVDWMAEQVAPLAPAVVVGIEARGFLFAGPLAVRLGAGMVPVRKSGKLPWQVEAEAYALEYGEDRLEIHRDAVSQGDTVVVVDDVLATGGTARATATLLERLGAKVGALLFVLELGPLGGRPKLSGWDVQSLVVFP